MTDHRAHHCATRLYSLICSCGTAATVSGAAEAAAVLRKHFSRCRETLSRLTWMEPVV